jgi:nucleotide-binding universal stress UspA family protein
MFWFIMVARRRKKMFNHIFVGLDGSDLAERVLPYVTELAGKVGSRITLLRAVSPADLIYPQPVGIGMPIAETPIEWETQLKTLELIRQDAQDYLNGITEKLRKGRPKLQIEPILVEEAAGVAILGKAKEMGADLIALTTHGRSGLARMILGSVADEVVRNSACPVLLVRVVEHQTQ